VFAPVVAPLSDRFDGVSSIGVVRGGGLGDLLFIVPALDALAATYPDATITVLGTPLARQVLDGRCRSVTGVELLPPAEGVNDVPEPVDGDAQRRNFIQRMHNNRFSLVAQMHGGGRYSNPFVLALGAQHTIGLGTADAEPLERTLDYVYYQHEVMRFLEVAALAGAAPTTLQPSLQPRPGEREVMAAAVHNEARGLVVVHPGATDPRRRWPPEFFTDVACRLTADGYQVIVVGDTTDLHTAEIIVSKCHTRLGATAGANVSSLAGQLSIGQLVGLLSNASLFIGNDSGPRHLAVALGVRTIGMFWVGNVINAGPLGRGEHRAHLSWTTRCPVCGRDATQVGWTAERCEHDVSFVAEIDPAAVYTDAVSLLAHPPTALSPAANAAGSSGTAGGDKHTDAAGRVRARSLLRRGR
jgi:ADP-heptose:LPS heptosyltransferase